MSRAKHRLMDERNGRIETFKNWVELWENGNEAYDLPDEIESLEEFILTLIPVVENENGKWVEDISSTFAIKGC